KESHKTSRKHKSKKDLNKHKNTNKLTTNNCKDSDPSETQEVKSPKNKTDTITNDCKEMNVFNCGTPAKAHEPQEIISNSDSKIDQKDSEPTEVKFVNETNCETQTDLKLPTEMNLHHETNCGTHKT
ncbi:MAG: hypothetical protein AB2693_06325, partial [Candidatus Thiodiazotropha sp.]